jgi:hypothetical protein
MIGRLILGQTSLKVPRKHKASPHRPPMIIPCQAVSDQSPCDTVPCTVCLSMVLQVHRMVQRLIAQAAMELFAWSKIREMPSFEVPAQVSR